MGGGPARTHAPAGAALCRLERQLAAVEEALTERADRETAAARLGVKNAQNRNQNLQVAYKQSAKAEGEGRGAVGGAAPRAAAVCRAH